MAELKTKPTRVSPTRFVNAIKDERRRRDAHAVMKMMRRVTGEKPYMWGSSIVGFGKYHYVYATGREGDCCVTGFSPRKEALTVYIVPGFHTQRADLKKLGKVKTGKSCVYIKRLEDVHMPTLARMVKRSFTNVDAIYAAMQKARTKKR